MDCNVCNYCEKLFNLLYFSFLDISHNITDQICVWHDGFQIWSSQWHLACTNMDLLMQIVVHVSVFYYKTD